MQHRSQPLSALVGRRERERLVRLLDLRLRPLMRCAIVDSGTRNALAISRVVRPPTARKVSGMAEAAVSDG